MILDRLLTRSAQRTFMEDNFGRQPYVGQMDDPRLLQLGDKSKLLQLLAQADVDAIAGNARGERASEIPPTLEGVDRLLAEGYTVGVRKAHQHDCQLAEFARQFERAFAAPVDIHLYCTPAGQPGFGWHYDAEDVFILQTAGSKEWKLRKNTVNPWPLIETLPQDMRYDRELMPLFRSSLAAGDWLYIPVGYWHKTEAGEESISLSIGILSPTGIDVLDFMRQELLDSLRWRERLPPLGEANVADEPTLHATYLERFSSLGQDICKALSDPALVQRFLTKRAAAFAADDCATRE